jgi:hypothetical protein
MGANHYDAHVTLKSDRYINEFDIQTWLRSLIDSHVMPDGLELQTLNVSIDYSYGEQV